MASPIAVLFLGIFYCLIFPFAEPNTIFMKNTTKTNFPKRLRVAALHFPRLFEFPKTPHGKPGGIDGKLLEALSQSLKFQYELIPSVDGEWGRIGKNGTWTGIIGMVQRGEADIGISTLGITPKRLEAADFSKPYMDMDLTFASNPPQLLPKIYAYLYPFDAPTWAISFSLLLGIPILLNTLSRKRYSYLSAFFYVYASLLGKYSSNISLQGSFFTLFWLCGSMLLTYCYVAVLPSFLLVPLREPPIRDFSELSTAVSKGKFKAFADKGTAHVEVMLNSGREDLALIANAMEKNQWFRDPTKYSDAVFLNQRMGKINGRLFLKLVPQTTNFISHSGFSVSYYGIAVNKNFCCKSVLDERIRRVLYGGLYQQFISEEIFSSRLSLWDMDREEENDFIISFDEIEGPFFIFLIGYCISFFVLFLEILTWNLMKKELKGKKYKNMHKS